MPARWLAYYSCPISKMATNSALSELTRDNKGRFVKIKKADTKKKAKKKVQAPATENEDHDYGVPSPNSAETRRSASPCTTSGTSSCSDWRVGQRLVEWEMLLTGRPGLQRRCV